jgi:alpha-beta hydrolase superfamily lysophospholipase
MLCWVASAAAVIGAAVADAGTRVTLASRDGLTLVGTLVEPDSTPAPAVLLLHGLGRSRHDWDRFAETLAARGIGSLALDIRGHGESGGPAPEDLSIAVADAIAGLEFLSRQASVAPGRLGIVGASIGANLAVLAGAGDSYVRAIVLLSPGLDYRGLKIENAMRRYGERAALIVTSQEDPYATRSSKVLSSTGLIGHELQVLEGAGHGAAMLDRAPQLTSSVVDWLALRLL